MIDFYVKFLLGIINACAAVILTFSIFKIPIKGNDKQIAVIGVIVGLTTFYLKFIVVSSVFQIVQIVVFTLIVAIIRRYPLLYSAAVCIIGSIAYSVIDGLVTYSSIELNLTTMDRALNNQIHYVYLHIVVTLLYILVAWLLCRFKLGFSFVVRRFSGRYSLSSATFVWAALLAIAVTVLQISSQNFTLLSLNTYLLVIAVVALITSIVYAYFQNKKSLLDRYGNNKK
jgi:hypothetical protein